MKTAPRPALRIAAIAAVLGMLLAPALAAAHPLGNFTINHYAGIRVSPDSIRLDVVIDRAEIPAFQERLRLDLDDDGDVSEAEADGAREPECRALSGALALSVDGQPIDVRLTAAGLSFPAGAGGLPTMRLVCGFEAAIPSDASAAATFRFADAADPDRIGWREIAIEGDGVTVRSVEGADPSATSVSGRLTTYPEDLLAQPLAVREIAWTVSPGGTALAPFVAPDAGPLASAAAPAPAVGSTGLGLGVPGGVGSEIPAIFQATDLSPFVLVLALLTAAALGAGHALTPGHGKTLMAAYLVGTRGTPLHAAGLGLSVTVSHTLGILILAALVAGSQQVLPTEVVVRATPVIAATTIVAIGAWMLLGEIRRRRAAASHDHGTSHAHEETLSPARGMARRPIVALGSAHAEDAAVASNHHQRGLEAPHTHTDAPSDGAHSHGGVTHSHLPTAGTTITWRSLFALGLAGGLIPSVNALLILLGTIAAGRPAFGVVLVIAFGLGMAAVMTGVGLAMVFARTRLERLPQASGLGRAASHAPLLAAVFVFGLGLWLTQQALFGAPVL